MTSRDLGFTVVCGVLIALYAFFFLKQEISRRETPSVPVHSLTHLFNGLEPIFKNIRYAGYVTDKDIEAPLTIATF